MGIFDEFALKNKIRKLNGYKTDLYDDYSSIQTYNGKIDNLIANYQSFIKQGNSAVVEKLSGYKEPYQYNDNTLTNARNYLQYEVNRLERELSSGGGD